MSNSAQERTFETILVEVNGRVATVTINRPDKLNALNTTVQREMVEAVEALDVDPGVGAIIVTGSKKAFAAGADIAEMAELEYPGTFTEDFMGNWPRLTRARTPLIAAVSGYALGGGCEVAMMCDIIIAADNAKFGQPEINLGVIPGMGGSQRLTRAVGQYKARVELPPADPARERRQIERLRALATEADLDPEFSEKFIRFVIDEVIRHHEQARKN